MTLAKKSSKKTAPKGRWIVHNLLLISTISAVFLGLAFGCVGRLAEPSKTTVQLVGFPGEMLMRMLKCIILPLIASSLVSSLAQLDIRHAGKMGSLALGYYLITTLMAIVTGIVMVLLIHPGSPDNLPANNGTDQKQANSALHTVLDLFRNMVPDNLVQATMKTAQTQAKGGIVNGTATDFEVVNKDAMNILGIIIVSIALGVVLSQMGPRVKPMVDLFAIMDSVSMRFVSMIMWYSPIGICSMIAAKILSSQDIGDMVRSMGMYTLTILAGLAIHGLITLPALYFLLTRRNPFAFMRGLIPALAVAFGTASSAGSLPVSLRCLEHDLGIDRRVARFVLPVGATINMDGTALYEAVATIFIAQMTGMQLNLGQIIVVSLTATLASIGAAAIPHGGLVTILMVLTAVGLRPDDISLIYAIDWLIDRFRTAINVMGDAFGAAIVDHHVRKHLPPPLADDRDELPLMMAGDGGEGDSRELSELSIGANQSLLLAANGSMKKKTANGTADGYLPVGNGNA